jgi:hypothetical protein
MVQVMIYGPCIFTSWFICGMLWKSTVWQKISTVQCPAWGESSIRTPDFKVLTLDSWLKLDSLILGVGECSLIYVGRLEHRKVNLQQLQQTISDLSSPSQTRKSAWNDPRWRQHRFGKKGTPLRDYKPQVYARINYARAVFLQNLGTCGLISRLGLQRQGGWDPGVGSMMDLMILIIHD